MLLSLLLVLAQGAAQPVPNASSADMNAAVQLIQQGRNDEALAALQKIAASDPNDHLARLWIASVHARMGHPELAETVYRSIALEDPTNVDAWVGLGTVLLQEDRVSEGLDALRRAEQLAPQNEAVWTALASAYRLAGEDGQSMAYYERLNTTSPTTPNRLKSRECPPRISAPVPEPELRRTLQRKHARNGRRGSRHQSASLPIRYGSLDDGRYSASSSDGESGGEASMALKPWETVPKVLSRHHGCSQ